MNSIGIPSWVSYLIVGCLWGCTNPFLKKGQESIDKAKNNEENIQNKEVRETQHAFSKWRICKLLDYHVYIPFCINQCGSLMFYVLLSSEPLGVVVPVINCLTFLFTALTATFIGNEKVDSPAFLFIGCIFVFTGMYLCANN